MTTNWDREFESMTARDRAELIRRRRGFRGTCRIPSNDDGDVIGAIQAEMISAHGRIMDGIRDVQMGTSCDYYGQRPYPVARYSAFLN
jgi:hypothetical protein